jgi:hypothetical protein
MRILNMPLKLFHTSVNETAMQNVQQYHFPEGGGGCGPNLPMEVVEIAKLYKYDENYRFFTASCDPYCIWVTFSET